MRSFNEFILAEVWLSSLGKSMASKRTKSALKYQLLKLLTDFDLAVLRDGMFRADIRGWSSFCDQIKRMSARAYCISSVEER
jgi:hypothetical protein